MTETAEQNACPVGNLEHVTCMYEKDGVFVATPGGAGGEDTQIPGRLQVYEKDSLAYVRWLPLDSVEYDSRDDDQGWAVIDETPAKGEVDESRQDCILHFALSEVFSVHCVQPVLSWQHLIFTLKPDKQLPAMFFQSALLREFWQCLNRYLVLVRSSTEDNLFEVRGGTDALSQSLRGLDFTLDETSGLVTGFFGGRLEGALGGLSRMAHFVRSQLSTTDECATDLDMDSLGTNVIPPGQAAAALSPDTQSAGGENADVSATHSASLESEENGGEEDELTPTSSLSVEAFRHAGSLRSGDEELSLVEAAEGAAPSSEMDAQATLTSSVRPGLSHTDVIDQQPRDTFSSIAPGETSAGNSLTQPGEAEEEEEEEEDEDDDDDANFQSLPCSLALPGMSLMNLDGDIDRGDPITWSEWNGMLDKAGRLRDVQRFRRRLFKGGLEPSLRPLVWKFLLGFYSFGSTKAERDRGASAKREDYAVMKQQWMSMKPCQVKRHKRLMEAQTAINKDVIRTDRDHPLFKDIDGPYLACLERILNTFLMYNFDLGYVQGMNDLLAPIIMVMDDESDAFWCFAGFMELVDRNFMEGLIGMRHQLDKLHSLLKVIDPELIRHLNKKVPNPSHPGEQLYFCFRWLLVLFKREFTIDETMRLWEVFWSQHLSQHFHLFFAAALLTQQTREIIAQDMSFSDVIRHVNGLADCIDLDLTLVEAERLCRQLLAHPNHNLPSDLHDVRPQLAWLGPTPNMD